MAISDLTGHSASDLLAIKDQLQKQLSRNLHAEPNDSHYVNPNETSKAFLFEVGTMLQRFNTSRRLNKADSPLLEYATMSGAGKTRWSFQVERLLKGDKDFSDCAVLRVGLTKMAVLMAAMLIAPKQFILSTKPSSFPTSKPWPVFFLRGTPRMLARRIPWSGKEAAALACTDCSDALFESAPEAE